MKSHPMRVLTDDQLRRWRDDQAAIIGGMSRSTHRDVGREMRRHQRTLEKIDAEIFRREVATPFVWVPPSMREDYEWKRAAHRQCIELTRRFQEDGGAAAFFQWANAYTLACAGIFSEADYYGST
jgi:hypothetical protein